MLRRHPSSLKDRVLNRLVLSHPDLQRYPHQGLAVKVTLHRVLREALLDVAREYSTAIPSTLTGLVFVSMELIHRNLVNHVHRLQSNG